MATGYWEGLTACAYDFPINMSVRSDERRDSIAKGFEEARANVFPKYETAQFSKVLVHDLVFLCSGSEGVLKQSLDSRSFPGVVI